MVLYARVTPAAFAGTAPAKQAAAKATANTLGSFFFRENAFFIIIYLQTFFGIPPEFYIYAASAAQSLINGNFPEENAANGAYFIACYTYGKQVILCFFGRGAA